VQHALWESAASDHLLLLEHPHVYTLGVRADSAHVLVDPSSVGADLERADSWSAIPSSRWQPRRHCPIPRPTSTPSNRS
jgi:hypothetical protein